ncbi:hypothetical protein GGX14DRAFT_391754 [Mycena pura]|uniref:C2H2-type domain-containing protein n=1 Tax=Mycena pura TaxID=153505 RepID=A0AAD6YE11_9AGAR|nr:hypothetical protein GGX14DRAFT_391754 [Mycena pura]
MQLLRWVRTRWASLHKCFSRALQLRFEKVEKARKKNIVVEALHYTLAIREVRDDVKGQKHRVGSPIHTTHRKGLIDVQCTTCTETRTPHMGKGCPGEVCWAVYNSVTLPSPAERAACASCNVDEKKAFWWKGQNSEIYCSSCGLKVHRRMHPRCHESEAAATETNTVEIVNKASSTNGTTDGPVRFNYETPPPENPEKLKGTTPEVTKRFECRSKGCGVAFTMLSSLQGHYHTICSREPVLADVLYNHLGAPPIYIMATISMMMVSHLLIHPSYRTILFRLTPCSPLAGADPRQPTHIPDSSSKIPRPGIAYGNDNGTICHCDATCRRADSLRPVKLSATEALPPLNEAPTVRRLNKPSRLVIAARIEHIDRAGPRFPPGGSAVSGTTTREGSGGSETSSAAHGHGIRAAEKQRAAVSEKRKLHPSRHCEADALGGGRGSFLRLSFKQKNERRGTYRLTLTDHGSSAMRLRVGPPASGPAAESLSLLATLLWVALGDGRGFLQRLSFKEIK